MVYIRTFEVTVHIQLAIIFQDIHFLYYIIQVNLKRIQLLGWFIYNTYNSCSEHDCLMGIFIAEFINTVFIYKKHVFNKIFCFYAI